MFYVVGEVMWDIAARSLPGHLYCTDYTYLNCNKRHALTESWSLVEKTHYVEHLTHGNQLCLMILIALLQDGHEEQLFSMGTQLMETKN